MINVLGDSLFKREGEWRSPFVRFDGLWALPGHVFVAEDRSVRLHLAKTVILREIAFNQLRGESEPGVGVLRAAGPRCWSMRQFGTSGGGVLTRAADDLDYRGSISTAILAKRCPANWWGLGISPAA